MSSYSDFWDECSLIWKESPTLSSDEVEAKARDRWIEQKKYNEFISFFIQNYGGGNCNDFIIPFANHLIEKGLFIHYKRIMTSIIRTRLYYLWGYVEDLQKKHKVDINELSGIDFSDFNQYNFSHYSDIKKAVAFHRDFTLQFLNLYKEGLVTLGEAKELINCDKMIETVTTLKKEKPAKATDKRKIDEELYWELISDARVKSSDNYEFVEHLQRSLEAFKKTEIKKFEKLTRQKCNELYTWKHWALAYIIRRGCSDDSFDYFRAWVVSQGFEKFNAVKELNESEFLNIFNEPSQLEEFLYIAENAYENVTGDYMPEVRVKAAKLTGEKFQEDKLTEQYPSLCELFNYKA